MFGKLMTRKMCATLVIACLLLFISGTGLASSKEDKDFKDFHPEQVLVKFVSGTPAFIKKDVHSKLGGVVIDEIPQLEVFKYLARKFSDVVGKGGVRLWALELLHCAAWVLAPA